MNFYAVRFSVVLFFLTTSLSLFSQLAINTDGSDPHPSAMLEVKSTDKGMLVPRVADASALTPPGGGFAEGLLVYQTGGTKGFYFWDGDSWELVGGGGGGSADNLGNHIAIQPIRLVNLSTADRNLLTPLPGMMIYNTDINKMQVYQFQAPTILEQFNGPDDTEGGCMTIAQRFTTFTSTTLKEIFADIDYNGGTGDITLNIISHGTGAGLLNDPVYNETFSFATINGNGNVFVLGTPLDLPNGQYTFEVTQLGNTDMIANIKKVIDAFWDPTDPFTPSPDPYVGGGFSKDGVSFDTTTGFPPNVTITRYDLGFYIRTQFASWVP